jgi:hypothetical protein
MRRIFLTLFFLSVVTISNSVFAQSPQFSKKSSAAIDDIKKTKVLVLATHHITHYKDDFSPTLLDSLIKVLKTYSPTAIGVE